MSGSVMFYLFLVVAALEASKSLLHLIGTGLYDMGQVRKQKQRMAHPYAKAYRQRPLISVIVTAHNNAAAIEQCLLSILKSSYRNYEIIVVNNASSDSTKRLVTEFAQAHPKHKIHILTKRKKIESIQALKAGFKKWATGELVMSLCADSIIDKQTLGNAVHHFAHNDVDILTVNARAQSYPSLTGVLQELDSLIHSGFHKLQSITGSANPANGTGMVCKREVFAKFPITFKSASKRLNLRYGNDVIIYTAPTASIRQFLQNQYHTKLATIQIFPLRRKLFFSAKGKRVGTLDWLRLSLGILNQLLLLAEPVLLTYFIYLALSFHKPDFYLIGWLVVSFVLAYAVWTAERLPLKTKLRLSIFIPIIYLAWYILTTIRIFVLIICCVVMAGKIAGDKTPSFHIRQTIRSVTNSA